MEPGTGLVNYYKTTSYDVDQFQAFNVVTHSQEVATEALKQVKEGFLIDIPLKRGRSVFYEEQSSSIPKKKYKREKDSDSVIHRLPLEVLCHIFSFLGVAEHHKIAQVCQQWNALSFGQDIHRAIKVFTQTAKNQENRERDVATSILYPHLFNKSAVDYLKTKLRVTFLDDFFKLHTVEPITFSSIRRVCEQLMVYVPFDVNQFVQVADVDKFSNYSSLFKLNMFCDLLEAEALFGSDSRDSLSSLPLQLADWNIRHKGNDISLIFKSLVQEVPTYTAKEPFVWYTALHHKGFQESWLPLELRDDKIFILQAIVRAPWIIQHISARLRKDDHFILSLLQQEPTAIDYIVEPSMENPLFQPYILARAGYKKENLSESAYALLTAILLKNSDKILEYSDNEQIIVELLSYYQITKESCHHYDYRFLNPLSIASVTIQDSESIILFGIEKDVSSIQFASDRIKSLKKFILEVCHKIARDNTEYPLESFPEVLKNNEEVALNIVKVDGAWLECFAEELRDSKPIVMAAVQQWGPALQFASERLKKDLDIVRAAISENGMAIRYVAIEMVCNKENLSIALSNNISSFRYLPSKMKNSPEFVLWVMEKTRRSPIIFGNYLDVSLEVIDYLETFPYLPLAVLTGLPLEKATINLTKDKYVVLKALRTDIMAFYWMDDDFTDDREVMWEAISQDASLLEQASSRLQDDDELVNFALSVDTSGTCLQYASLRLQADPILQYRSKVKQRDRKWV